MVGYHKHDILTTNQKLIAGCLSGIITRFLTQPLDIIKLRMQLHRTKKTKGVYRTARRIFLEEGVKAFWHGHLIGQIHSIFAVSSQFYMYEVTTKYVGALGMEHNAYMRFICGVFAGCCSATLVTPLEVIRVRQMVVKDQYSSLLKGAKAVYRYGGFLAFYEGISASLLQLGPQVGISFLVFSYTQPAILHYFEPPPIQCKSEEECKKQQGANRYTAKNLLVSSTVAGCLAGTLSKTLTYPLDLVKRRLQLGTHRISAKYQVPSTSQRIIQCTNLVECFTKTIQKEGARGLFRGWSITIWKAQLTSLVAFTSYELLCFTIREYVHIR